MSATAAPGAQDSLAMMLRVLKLPTMNRHAEEVALKAEHEGWSFGQYLRHLVGLELEELTADIVAGVLWHKEATGSYPCYSL